MAIRYVIMQFLCVSSMLLAQEGWEWQNPLPQANTLLNVCFSDDDNGTAVGYYGVIVRTIDGGFTWIAQNSGTNELLRDVSFSDQNNGTVVGSEGIILNTKNGGNTWSFQNSGTTEDLYGVSFSDTDHGTAVGVAGTILRTTDGGKHWSTQSSSVTGTYCNLFSVCFTDENNGTLVGSDGIVQHTTDGGETWVSQNSNTTKTLHSVSFFDDNNGVAVGSAGTTIMTKDGGANWTLMQVTENTLYDVSFSTLDNILIAGKSTTLVRISDGGSSFNRYYQIGENDFFGASLNTVVGTSGQIFNTPDEGETWNDQRTGSLRKLRGVSFVNQNVGTVVGDNGTILRTINGGRSWISQSFNSASPNGSLNDCLKAVSFSSEDSGYIVSGLSFNDGSITYYGTYGLILGTQNGGATWSVQYTSDNAAFNGIFAINANTCVAVGVYRVNEVDQACWFTTDNGGTDWEGRYFSSITDPLTDVCFVDAANGILVGHNGRIMITDDGAESWNTRSSGTVKDLHCVCFADAVHAIVVGDDGTILRTSDKGTSWEVQTSGTNEDLYCVSFADEKNGMIAGSNGTTLKSEDGGVHWAVQQAVTSEDLFAAAMADENTGTLAGDNGTILHTTTGGSSSVLEQKVHQHADKYRLLNNYPNPFNPITQIEFDVPENSYVTLNVYDVLGRRLSTLVDQNMQAGHYGVEFNAGHRASGVYYYQMRVGDFSVTKKMLLSK